MDERRRVYVEQIADADLAGVVDGHEVFMAVRLACRDCGREVYLPASSRGTDDRVTTYQVFARSCPDHRRRYERPAVMPRVRDTQRSAVYRWEQSLPPAPRPGRWTPPDPIADLGRRRGRAKRREPRALAAVTPNVSFAECERLASDVWDRLMTDDPDPPPSLVLATRRRRRSSATADRITLAPTMLHPMTVLHELAHAAVIRSLPPGTYAPHGPEFATLYLGLLEEWLGLPAEVGRGHGDRLRPRRVRFASRDLEWVRRGTSGFVPGPPRVSREPQPMFPGLDPMPRKTIHG
ncbi:MAG: hypothetical protein MJB57_05130 [Gemmatimonadetes bacterium]|nr:hypothetical protein [Gemmatimonadota bacterium]